MVGSTNFPGMLLGLGNGSSSGSTSRSCRREKEKMKKPLKQPQRGPGVAQLEKILLHNQIMAATSLSPFQYSSHHHISKDTGRAPALLHMGYPSSPSSSSSSSIATAAASSSSSSSSSLFDLHSNSVIDFGENAVGIVMRNGSVFHSAPSAASSALPSLYGRNSETNSHQGHDQGCFLSQSVCGSQELDLELRL